MLTNLKAGHSNKNEKRSLEMETYYEVPNKLFRLHREKFSLKRELENYKKNIEVTLPVLKRKREDYLKDIKNLTEDNHRKKAKLELTNVRLQYKNKFLHCRLKDAAENYEKIQHRIVEKRNHLCDLEKRNNEVQYDNQMMLERNFFLDQERKRLENRLKDCNKELKEQSHSGALIKEAIDRLKTDVSRKKEQHEQSIQAHKNVREGITMRMHERYSKEYNMKFRQSMERLYNEFKFERLNINKRDLNSNRTMEPKLGVENSLKQNVTNDRIDEMKQRILKLESVNDNLERLISHMENGIARQETRYIEHRKSFERDFSSIKNQMSELKDKHFELLQIKQAQEWEKMKYENLTKWKALLNDISKNNKV